MFGDAVNVAARLQALAKPGGVMISGTVYDQVHAKIAARYVDAGMRQVKNIREPVRTFEVLPAAPPGMRGRVAAVLSRFCHGARCAPPRSVGAVGRRARARPLLARHPGAGDRPQLWARSCSPQISAPPNSLAVLPFDNMTGNPADDYLGDGLAEELLHRLSRVSGLRVAARRSAFAYKGRDVDVREIADALGVNYVVEGSVRRQGGIVRVNAALVERASGANRWSESYESSGDFYAIEEDIGTQVLRRARAGARHRSGRLPAPRAGDIAAYDLYLQGLSYLRQPKSVRTSRRGGAAVPARARGAGRLRPRAGRALPDAGRALPSRARAGARRGRGGSMRNGAVARSLGLRSARGNRRAASRHRRRGGSGGRLPPRTRNRAGVAGCADRARRGARRQAGTWRRPGGHSSARLRRSPLRGIAHAQYGSLLVQQGRAREAIAPFQHATLLEPDNAGAFNNLGARVPECRRIRQGCRGVLAIAGHRAAALQLLEHRHRAVLPAVVSAKRRRCSARRPSSAPADHRAVGQPGRCAPVRRPPGRGQGRVRPGIRARGRGACSQPENGDQPGSGGILCLSAPERGPGPAVHRERPGRRGGRQRSALSTWGWPSSDSAIEASAVTHVRRARELGYPEVFLKSAPELRRSARTKSDHGRRTCQLQEHQQRRCRAT